MKKFAYLLLSLVLVFSLLACEDKSKDHDKEAKDDKKIEKEEKEGTEEKENSAEKNSLEDELSIDTTLKLPTIEEQVLFDQDNIKIVAKAGDLTQDILGDVIIPVEVENNSANPIDVFLDNSAINGLTLDTFDVLTNELDPLPGEKKEGYISVSFLALHNSDITEVGDIVTDIKIDTGNKENPGLENVEIKTSLSGKVKQKVNKKGQVLYDENGVKLVVRERIKETSIGPALEFYFENTSKNYVNFHYDSPIVLNGKKVEHNFSMGLKPGAKAIIQDLFLDQQEPIKTLDMKIVGEDADFLGKVIIPQFEVHLEF